MPEPTDQPPEQPSPRAYPIASTPGDIYIAAATADHLAHCANCRERHEEAEARYAEYGASIRRRDRVTLGLRAARTTAVAA